MQMSGQFGLVNFLLKHACRQSVQITVCLFLKRDYIFGHTLRIQLRKAIVPFPVSHLQIKQLHVYLQASQIIDVSFKPNNECSFFLNN